MRLFENTKKKSKYCYVIAEAELNHNGSIEIANKLIDLVSNACDDVVKFQKRTIDNLAIKSTLNTNNDRFTGFDNKTVLNIPVDELLSLGVFE